MDNIKFYNILISKNILDLNMPALEFKITDENMKNILEEICFKNNYEILIRKAQR